MRPSVAIRLPRTLYLAACLLASIPIARAADAKPTTPVAIESVATSRPAEEVESADEELFAQELSNAARIRMDRARDSVVQIRGFFGDSQSDAFHGTGFAAGRNSKGEDGLLVTNYHVVSEAVLHPNQYRLEFLAHDGRSGKLTIHAIDVEHDLAIVKADNFAPPPLRLRTQIPNKGERAYSIGFPLDLGLTITEGVANGLVENTLDQRIHYSGAMNGGMSGGPALDANGAVYGVNVSVLTGGQSVSFVVPAKHIGPLLARAHPPIDMAIGREQVGKQLVAHQETMFAAIPAKLATQELTDYVLPAKLAPAFECNSGGSADPNNPVRTASVTCFANVGVYVQRGLSTGDIYFRHRVLESEQLQALQFSDLLNRSADTFAWGGSPQHVAPFACTTDLVALAGFDARISICVRQYRMYAELYDIGMTVVSVNQSQRAVVSNVRLRAVGFNSGMDLVRRFLGAMQWKP